MEEDFLGVRSGEGLDDWRLLCDEGWFAVQDFQLKLERQGWNACCCDTRGTGSGGEEDSCFLFKQLSDYGRFLRVQIRVSVVWCFQKAMQNRQTLW
jgi:hypothetical protein